MFWARGGPVALLRGANRPLLTRLIIEEVTTEAKQSHRPFIEIDFTSPKVIQCANGDLAQLEYDDVVRSIGCGNTDKLSSFFNSSSGVDQQEFTKSLEQHDSMAATNSTNTDGVDRDEDGDDNAEGMMTLYM